MPIKIIADYREILIDIFFAIIIVVGFDRFMREFLLHHITEISSPPITLDTLFFFAAYFWVISHWVSYHELVTKYPYYRWRKFFVDVFLFSVMFIIINISFEADRYEISLLLVWLLIIWYIFACMWHLSDWGLRPLRLYLTRHIWRVVTYAALLLFLYNPLGLPFPNFALVALDITNMLSLSLVNAIFSSSQYMVMVFVILAMILWNVDRLTRFMGKDSRYYDCIYISGYPGRNKEDPGQLEMTRYPIGKKIGDRGKDRIIFKGENFQKAIEISIEQISNTKVGRTGKQPNQTDLRLEIEYKDCQSDGTVKDIKILFDLDDQIIASVGEGVKELLKRNKHGDSSPF